MNREDGGRRNLALPMIVVLFAAAGVASYAGIRADWRLGAATSDEAARLPGGAAVSLPYEESPAPPGPHRESFQTSCLICHSGRLAFGQPTLKPEKWAETVHKMAASYGAPLTKEEEPPIVEYLLAVQSARDAR